jgi:hypothetical protein
VFGAELIRWFAEVLGKRPNGVQVQPDRGRRIMPDLEVLQHPLSKWGHNKTPFVVTTSQIDFQVAAQVGGASTRAFTCRRLSCVLGMLSSLEVKVLCPT